ncbi:CFE protein [Tanacetum coccineum]
MSKSRFMYRPVSRPKDEASTSKEGQTSKGGSTNWDMSSSNKGLVNSDSINLVTLRDSFAALNEKDKVFENVDTSNAGNEDNIAKDVTEMRVRVMLSNVLKSNFFIDKIIVKIVQILINDIPLLYSTILSWLRPPYLYVIINTIIITIAATSRFHHTSNQKVQSQPLDHLPPVTVPPMINVYEDVNTLPEVSTVVYEVEHPVIDDEPVVVDDKEVVVVNESQDIYEVTRSTWQSPVEKVQTEFVFPVREKPLASSRFAGQRKLTAKVNPEEY